MRPELQIEQIQQDTLSAVRNVGLTVIGYIGTAITAGYLYKKGRLDRVKTVGLGVCFGVLTYARQRNIYALNDVEQRLDIACKNFAEELIYYST